MLANPPIGRIEPDGPLVYEYPIRTHDRAGLFIEHALRLLKPGGRAVIAVPDGLLFRRGDQDLRRELV